MQRGRRRRRRKREEKEGGRTKKRSENENENERRQEKKERKGRMKVGYLLHAHYQSKEGTICISDRVLGSIVHIHAHVNIHILISHITHS